MKTSYFFFAAAFAGFFAAAFFARGFFAAAFFATGFFAAAFAPTFFAMVPSFSGFVYYLPFFCECARKKRSSRMARGMMCSRMCAFLMSLPLPIARRGEHLKRKVRLCSKMLEQTQQRHVHGGYAMKRGTITGSKPTFSTRAGDKAPQFELPDQNN